MPDFATLFVENPSYFVLIFAGVLILFLIAFILSKVVSSKKKRAQRNAGNMAELVFDQTIRPASQFFTDVQFTGYKVFTVNGVEPSVIGKSIFTPAGNCQIELQYIGTTYATRTVSSTTIHEKQMLEFDVQANRTYRIAFDEKHSRFAVQ